VPADAGSAGPGPADAGGAAGAGPADADILRRTRFRLIAWSGGLTLLILVLLGALVYWAVAGALARQGTTVLENRAEEAVRVVSRPGPLPDRPHR